MTFRLLPLDVEPFVRLDAEGRVVRSPAIEKLVASVRTVIYRFQIAAADNAFPRLIEALAEVDAEAHALELDVGAQTLVKKEASPFVEHGLETPKPGGEPGSDVASELQAPGLSVTSESEK